MEKNWITTIQALLKGRNDEFDAADKKRVRLIRHKDNRKVKVIDGKEYANSLYDIYLHDNDVFMAYQSEQVKKRFLNVDYIVAFIGEEGVSSRFVGVYKNCGVIKDIEEYHDEEQAKFDFQEIAGFDNLKERVVIDWRNPLVWLQNYANEMPVTRIDRGLRDGNIPVFTRFEDVLLDYSQLHVIFKTNNAEWKAKLESWKCNSLKSIYALNPQGIGIKGKPFEEYTQSQCTLYIPKGSMDNYKRGEEWNAFTHIVEFSPTGIGGVHAAAERREVERYDTSGRRLTSPTKGLNIVRFNDGTTRKVMK